MLRASAITRFQIGWGLLKTAPARVFNHLFAMAERELPAFRFQYVWERLTKANDRLTWVFINQYFFIN
jgi:hypothetical protein